jgi:O-antigen ligase/tetratricopeptide (TPR) repeat protein
MQESRWARWFRGALEGSWLLIFGAVPLVFSRAAAVVFIHDKVPLFRGLVEVGVLMAILGALLGGLRTVRRPSLGLAVAAYAGVLLVATLCGRNPWGSWWGQFYLLTGTFTLLHGTALFGLMACYMTRAEQRLRWVRVTLVAAALVSVYAIVQWLGRDPFTWPTGYDASRRAFSTIGNASHLAAYLVFVIPLTLGALMASRKPLTRAALGITLTLEMLALGATLTRGAWLATAALLGVFALLVARQRGRRGLARAAFAFVLLVAVGLGVINARPALLAGVSNRYVRRLANLWETSPGSSGGERLLAWQIVGETAHGPGLLLGYGPESYIWTGSRAYHPTRSRYSEVGQLMESPHNIFLGALTDLGLAGVLALLALLGAGFTTALRALRRTTAPIDEALLIAAISALVGYVIQGMFLYDRVMMLMFVMGFLALIASIAHSSPAAVVDTVTPQPGKHALQPPPISTLNTQHSTLLAAALATALVTWMVADLNVNDWRANVALRAGVPAGPVDAAKLEAAVASVRSARQLSWWEPEYRRRLAEMDLARVQSTAPPPPARLPEECRAGLVEAEREARAAAAMEPSDFRPDLRLGALYGFWAQYEPRCLALGIQAFQDATARTPRRQQVFWEWGKFYMQVGQPRAARERFEHALAMDPRTATSHRMLAFWHLNTTHPQEAEQEFKVAWALEVQSTDPANPEFLKIAPRRALEHEQLAQLFLQTGQRSRAAAHLRAALALNEDNPRARALLAQLAAARPHGRKEG